jgi:hypothetical protein
MQKIPLRESQIQEIAAVLLGDALKKIKSEKYPL